MVTWMDIEPDSGVEPFDERRRSARHSVSAPAPPVSSAFSATSAVSLERLHPNGESRLQSAATSGT